MNEETFKVRAYGFGELAQLYFPNITKKSAAAQLKVWLIENKPLIQKLKGIGFKDGNRILTPNQVKCIIKELGEP